MKIVWSILDQPFFLVLYIWRELWATAALVQAGLIGERPFSVVAAGQFAGWVVAIIIVAAVVIVTARFILENATFGSVLSRLLVVLMLYVVLAVLFYALANFANMITHEMDYVPPR
jgi:hypothetical protein